MKTNNSLLLIMIIVSVVSISGCASSAGGFQQANSLSLNLTKVANEGAAFNSARDKLAKLRLKNLHYLQNSTATVQQYNSESLYAWQFSGESLRQELYNSVIATSQRTQNYRNQLAAVREKQQEQAAKQKSAIDFKNGELIKAAKLFAQLGEQPDKKAQLKQYLNFFRTTWDKIEAERDAQTEELEAASEPTGSM